MIYLVDITVDVEILGPHEPGKTVVGLQVDRDLQLECVIVDVEILESHDVGKMVEGLQLEDVGQFEGMIVEILMLGVHVARVNVSVMNEVLITGGHELGKLVEIRVEVIIPELHELGVIVIVVTPVSEVPELLSVPREEIQIPLVVTVDGEHVFGGQVVGVIVVGKHGEDVPKVGQVVGVTVIGVQDER